MYTHVKTFMSKVILKSYSWSSNVVIVCHHSLHANFNQWFNCFDAETMISIKPFGKRPSFQCIIVHFGWSLLIKLLYHQLLISTENQKGTNDINFVTHYKSPLFSTEYLWTASRPFVVFDWYVNQHVGEIFYQSKSNQIKF